MKKKIAILGSTGSIGKALLQILSKNKKTFDIHLLTINKNYKDLIDQTRKFNVKNVIIIDELSYKNFKKINKNKKINIFNNFNSFDKIFSTKIDYVMSSIVGIEGLFPTVEIIKYTKNIAIANKESIICAWNLISKELKNNNTNFLPVDSEHFSIWYGIKNNSISNISKIYLTASGGPLLKIPKKKYKFLNINKIIKHPNWSMGKKISIDSATMMNKVFEVIETQKIFNLPKEKIGILIHEKSYVHAIVEFKNGLSTFNYFYNDMNIPLINFLSISLNHTNIKLPKNYYIKNNFSLNFIKPDEKIFPIYKTFKKINKNSIKMMIMFNVINEIAVDLFKKNKIRFDEINTFVDKYLSLDLNLQINNIEKVISFQDKLKREILLKIND